MTATRLYLLTSFLLLAAVIVPPRIAIIIDDLGYRFDAGKRAIALPGPVSLAVLPGAPRTRALDLRAYECGKEVLLHLPLQAKPNDELQEPLGIRLDMSRSEFDDTFGRALRAVPHATGVSTHRGSLLTRHPGHMQWLMEDILAREPLFFIDSFTTLHSVALKIAGENGVDARKRDVFLDPDQKPETVVREFERMKGLARKRGSIIAIGHPYATTLSFLERELPKLEAQGYELVSVSDLMQGETLQAIQSRHQSLQRQAPGGGNKTLNCGYIHDSKENNEEHTSNDAFRPGVARGVAAGRRTNP